MAEFTSNQYNLGEGHLHNEGLLIQEEINSRPPLISPHTGLMDVLSDNGRRASFIAT